MSKPFIIGNGFDLAHSLPTSHECFHDYLRKTYPDADEDTPCVPWSGIDHHGEEIWDPVEVAGYLMNLLFRTAKENWSDFEEALGLHLSAYTAPHLLIQFAIVQFPVTVGTERQGLAIPRNHKASPIAFAVQVFELPDMVHFDVHISFAAQLALPCRQPVHQTGFAGIH